MKQSYPPRGMERQSDLTVTGAKHLKIESYLARRNGSPDWLLTDEAVWLISPTAKRALSTPALIKDNPFPLDRFAISPNEDFIFGARKLCAGDSDMFLWVRQKDKSYKLLPETVNTWIVRRRGAQHKGGAINFIHLVRWLDGGNGVALAGTYRTGKHNYWHLQEIDLVRGKFPPDRVIGQQKLTFLI